MNNTSAVRWLLLPLLLFLAIVVPAPAAQAAPPSCDASQAPSKPSPSVSATLSEASDVASLLDVKVNCVDRFSLQDGNELVRVSGVVTNPTEATVQVPPLDAVIRSKSGQLIYQWTIAPVVNALAPGASTTFDSSELEVPPGGEDLTITAGGILPDRSRPPSGKRAG